MKYFKNNLSESQGAVALILVIMITALTVSSLVIISLNNIDNLTASYRLSESESTAVNMDGCMEDIYLRLASSTAASGAYYVDVGNVTCYYEIDSAITDGIKLVTSTASTTTSLGTFYDSMVVQVNVEDDPITIEQINTGITEYSSNYTCGDGVCNYEETCDSCEADCGSCQTCGNSVVEGTEACDDGNTTTETQTCGNSITENGSYCNADCTAAIELTEACDDGNTTTEGCGDGVLQSGSYCNSNCSSVLVLDETCDYTGGACAADTYSIGVVGCSKYPYCQACTTCIPFCESP